MVTSANNVTTAFPYDIHTLHWDQDHKSNTEGVYCYCGNDKGPDEPMLQCQNCHQLFHSDHVSCLTMPFLKGDEFFKFQCSVCNQGPEFFERAALSWVILVHLVLYNLMDTHPEQKYFRWKEEICKFILEYWQYLLPEKEQSPTWNNTVASVLSVQNHIFQSGVEIKGAAGWWTLIDMAPPDRNRKLKPKNKVSTKSGGNNKGSGSKNKDRRPSSKGSPSRKKTKFDETSSDDDFHTSAKPRPLSNAPTTRIKSRQISFSSGSSLSSAGSSDDSLDDEAYWKSEDERDMQPVVKLHGIPACIRHHFNPSGLDFSAGAIDLEHLFRLADLIDDDSPGKLIHKVRAAVNSVGAVLALSGKAKRRKSSIADIKAEPGRRHSMDKHRQYQGQQQRQYQQQYRHEARYDDNPLSDLSASESDSDLDDTDSSSGDSDSDDDEVDNRERLAQQKQAQNRAMAAKRIAGNHGARLTSPPAKRGSIQYDSLGTPGVPQRRKSSLKSSTLPTKPTAASRKVTIAPTTVSHAPPRAGGKVFSNPTYTKAGNITFTTSNSSKRQASPGDGLSPKHPIYSKSTINGNTTIAHFSSNDSHPPVMPIMPSPPVLSQQEIQRQKEWHVLQVLENAPKPLPSVVARFKRKLHLKRLKEFLHLPLFDLENYLYLHLDSPLDLSAMSKQIPIDPYELARQRQELFQSKVEKINHTPFGNSFASRLVGSASENFTRKSWEPAWVSPYTGQVLKDFIWRDYGATSDTRKLLNEIKARNGKPVKGPHGASGLFGKAGKKRRRDGVLVNNSGSTTVNGSPALGEPFQQKDHDEDPILTATMAATEAAKKRLTDENQGSDMAPIDYCYLRKEHLPQVNAILCRRFWPGIDMTEALQYPDYSVVVLYKRLVVGCAFMTPEGYVTYVAVSAGWEKAGIGQTMLYHLIRAANGNDITLHVSANNPAMIMYQKFGFKPEEFMVNFYDKYLPANSRMCNNAFFVRLRR